MRRLLPLVLVACTAPAFAQDAEERDRGFLTGLIEDNLDAPGLSVRIDGFEGALSSRATLDTLSVSDDEGVWLTLQDVSLDWNRSALLRGRLEVEELSAGLIRVERAPLPPEGVEALPDAGASGFSLPELPVSVDIEALQADRIELGEAILGQDLALLLDASAQLADGSGQVRIEAQRLDGPAGVFSIAASYGADDQRLEIDVALSEGEDGIAATLLQLPGQPAIDLTVRGAGPLDDFAADISVASQGQERLGGRVALSGAEDGRAFDVEIGGDVTTLFAPRYRPFFGNDVQLLARGTLREAGGTDLDTLRLTTQALSLEGGLSLAADGWPEFMDLRGRIAAEGGEPVLLPTADESTLGQADLTLAYDADQSEDWRLDLRVQDYSGATLGNGDATVTACGAMDRTGGAVTQATAAVEAALNDLTFVDPALAEAVGPRIGLTTDVVWQDGAPLEVSGLSLTGTDYDLTGDVALDLAGEGLPLTLDIAADLADLSRLSGIAGRDLAGAAELGLSGTYAPVADTFDLNAQAETVDLAVGIAQADDLLAGRTSLTVAARRTVEGTFLDTFDIENEQLTVGGSAALLAEEAREADRSGQATLTARLADGAILDPRLDGAVEFSANLAQSAETGAWSGAVDATAPQGIALSVEGMLTGESPAVDFSAEVPDLSGFAETVPGGLSLAGRAASQDGIWSVEAQASGPWDLDATVSGPVTGPAPQIAFDATLPDLSGPVPAVEEIEALNGPVSLSGTLAQRDEIWSIDTSLSAPSDVSLRARGPLTGNAPRIEFAGTVPEVQDFVPAVEGRLDLDGSLARVGEIWIADIAANGPYGADVTARSALTQSPLRVTFGADIPDLSRVAPAVPGGLSVSGEAMQTEAGWQVDLDGTGPYDATLDASLDLADGVPSVTADGQIPDASALAPQLRGPLNYDVSASQTDAGWQVDAQVEGAQALSVTVEGLATGPQADLDFRVQVGNVAAFAPGLPGPLDASGRLFQQNGEWAADVDASGPLGAQLDASGTLTGGAAQAQFDLSVPDISPLVPDLAGPLRVSGTAQQQGEAWTVDVDATGSAGTQADVSGQVGTDATLDLSVTGSVPLGLANPAIAPRRLAGVAQFDLSVSGPPALDSVSGTIRTSGAALSLPTLPTGLDDIDATITLADSRAQVALTAAPSTGGRLSVNGPIDLAPPLNADLAISFDVTLEDPSLYTADVDGALTLTGPLTGGAVIGGTINIDGAEVAVPSSGLTAVGDLPAITHLATPRPVRRTLARAGQDDAAERAAEEASGSSGPPFRLDIAINAPGRVFVRGRGLDAELGGRLRVTGRADAPVTAGGFELVRGRLDILQQRFDLDEGTITFQGGLVPFIRLVAITETDTITASIIIEGPADDIEVRFESSPDVPQEEILAQIFFGRGLSQLSPLQALQLANSVAVLAGRGQAGLLDNLRGRAGLDDLDITTDDEGNVALRAGKYVSDNVYTDVQIDQDGEATISLNLDITPNLTARGSAGATGDTSLGLFYERDY